MKTADQNRVATQQAPVRNGAQLCSSCSSSVLHIQLFCIKVI